ncbi:MAG: phosphoglucosamine mutase, partial [Candidatus Aenigmarchaeota archaeon]|nr:phosphoglucosamine mutase [Candidatus Aenigmarchaeota archaeon]
EQYEKVNTLDGVRVDFDDGWVLVRASNTTPIIRITSEAVDEKTRDGFLNKYMKIVEDEIKGR